MKLRLSALALALTLGGVACQGDEAPEAPAEEIFRVRTEVAGTDALANEIITSAVIEAEQWQPLYFDAGGMVRKVGVKENQRVNAGAILAELDNEALILNVAKAELNVESAKLNEEQAAHKLEQTKALIETGGASPEDVYDREQRLLESQNQVKSAELNLATQRLKLSDSRLTAPFDGMVSEVNIRVGELVHGDVSDPDRDLNRRPPMVMVEPDSGMIIRAQLPEGRATEVKAGIRASVTLMEHRDVTLSGAVTQVSSTVDRETRTVHVRIELEVPPGGFPPSVRDGATALVTLMTDVRQDAVTVSERALFYFQGQVYAFVVQPDKTVSRVPLVTGVMRAGKVEVVSGLNPGDVVARSHLYLLRDGQLVNPQPQDGPLEGEPEGGALDEGAPAGAQDPIGGADPAEQAQEANQ